MKKKRIVIALGHEALGSTLPEQQKAAARTAKAVADFIREDYQVVITHSNGPQVGMIHTAMNEFCRLYPEYTATPTSVCSAMSQGYIGYDLQNAIRTELLNRGIYKTVSTVLTQVVVDPYDEAFYHPTKVIGRVMTKEEAEFIVIQYLDQGLIQAAEDYAQKWGLNLSAFNDIKVYSDDQYDDEHDPS